MKKKIASPLIVLLAAAAIIAGAQAAPAQEKTPMDFAARKYARTTDKTAQDKPVEPEPAKPLPPMPDLSDISEPHPAPTADQTALDMEQSAHRAIETNPQIQSAKAALRGAIEGKKSALGALGPSGNVSGSWQTQSLNTAYKSSLNSSIGAANSWMLDLNVHQNLFVGFRLLSTYQKAALAKDSAEAGVAAAELSLLNAVQLSFLSLLKARSDVKNAEDSVANLTSQLTMSRAFYEVGLVPRLDVLQNETALANGQQTLIAARNSVLTQEAQLNSYLSYPLEQQVNYVGELSYLPFAMNLEQCLDQAYKNRPDLYVAVKSVEIAAKDAKIAISGMYPQVAADLDYITSTNRSGISSDNLNYDQQVWQAKLSMKWTAWDWGSTYFGYAQAVENVKKMYADMVTLRLNIGFQVKSSFLNILNAAKQIRVAKTGLDSARENYRMAVARYKAQIGTSLDVLTAQSQLTQAESNLTQAMAEYQTALANLYAAIGAKNYTLTPG
ncbi:MAG: TolC family protein [Desulfovibrionaceae bacterium]|nr:TolC family protein [Desulfovibrionaceae bacterium]MBF0513983.1 TolC family protein [Desulfovibrionaceae bacterium]